LSGIQRKHEQISEASPYSKTTKNTKTKSKAKEKAEAKKTNIAKRSNSPPIGNKKDNRSGLARNQKKRGKEQALKAIKQSPRSYETTTSKM
jgi:hypothetical protein